MSAIFDSTNLSLFKTGDVFIITLQNGENRITDSFIADYHKALDLVEQTEGPLALVTTSSDKKFFSNGLDFDGLAQEPPAAAKYLESVQRLYARVMTFPCPTVAAVNGHCIAGGGFLALCHDYVAIANDVKAFFFFNEIDFGASFSVGLASIFKTKIKNSKLINEIAVLGKRFSLGDTVKLGIFHFEFPLANLKENAVSIAQQWAPKAEKRVSMALIKREIYSETLTYCTTKVPESLFRPVPPAKL